MGASGRRRSRSTSVVGRGRELHAAAHQPPLPRAYTNAQPPAGGRERHRPAAPCTGNHSPELPRTFEQQVLAVVVDRLNGRPVQASFRGREHWRTRGRHADYDDPPSQPPYATSSGLSGPPTIPTAD